MHTVFHRWYRNTHITGVQVACFVIDIQQPIMALHVHMVLLCYVAVTNIDM